MACFKLDFITVKWALLYVELKTDKIVGDYQQCSNTLF